MYSSIYKISKAFIAFSLAITMMIGFSVPVQAARFEKEDGTIFDEAYYYINNPDVAASCGPNMNALYNHYKTTGKAEGRLPADPSGKSYIWYTLFQDQADAIFPKVDVVLSQITNSSMSDRQKVDAVVNWMCDNISYDYDYASNDFRGGRDAYPQYVLEDGIAVCDGYAKLFQCFMYRLGIPCTYVSGYAGGDNHGWNSVRLDGTWYVIDVTWIDSHKTAYSSDKQYFAIKNPENLPDDLREKVLSRLQQANEEFSQKMQENSTSSYYLTDMNIGWSDHYPSSHSVLSVVSGWDEFLNNASG